MEIRCSSQKGFGQFSPRPVNCSSRLPFVSDSGPKNRFCLSGNLNLPYIIWIHLSVVCNVTDWLTDWLTEYWLHDLLMSGVVLIFETYRGSCRKRKSANESNEEVAQQKKIVIDKVYIDNDDRLDMPGLPDCFWTPFVRPCQTGETLSLGIHGNLCGDCRLGLAEMCHTGSLLCIVGLSDRRNTGMCHTGVIFVGLDQRNTGVFSGFVCHTGSRNTGMTSSQWSLGNMDGAKH